MAQVVCVVGAGTGIGKTFIGRGLVRAARGRGWSCRGLKPVESGVADVAEDAEALGREAGLVVSPRYALRRPVSPHLAAREAGTRIDLSEVARWVARESSGLTFVETAGGLLSPLDDEGATNLDLCVALAPSVVVAVAADELGALHQVSSLMLALGERSLRARTVVALNRIERGAEVLDNGGELVRLGVSPRLRTIPAGGGAGDFDDLLDLVLEVSRET